VGQKNLLHQQKTISIIRKIRSLNNRGSNLDFKTSESLLSFKDQGGVKGILARVKKGIGRNTTF